MLVLILCALCLAAPLVWVDAEPTTLNPLFARTGADDRAQELIFDRLFFEDPLADRYTTRLVVDMETSADERELRLVLKPGITWHDGFPFAAADVCFTVAALTHPDTPTTWPHADMLAGCRVEGEDAVIRFSRVPRRSHRRWLGFRVLPAHAFDSPAIGMGHPFGRAPIGLGHFAATWERDRIRFSHHPNPHHADGPTAAELRFERGPATSSLASGEAQGWVDVPLPQQAAAAAVDGMRSVEWERWGVAVVSFSLRGDMEDPAVRRILARSLEGAEVLPGAARATGPWRRASPMARRPLQEPDDVELLRGVRVRVGVDAELSRLDPGLGQRLCGRWEGAGLASCEPVRLVGSVAEAPSMGLDAAVGLWTITPPEDPAVFLDHGNPWRWDHPDREEVVASWWTARDERSAHASLEELWEEEAPFVFLCFVPARGVWSQEVRDLELAPRYVFTLMAGFKGY